MTDSGLRTRRLVLGAIALLLAGHLVLGPIRRGWNGMETDFPNYYTAARLTVQHQPLRMFYDWTWFQRQINYAGIEHQLGGYIPHTPLTMIPFIPLARLPAQQAKRVWIAVGVLLLAVSVVLLARLSGFGVLEVTVLALAADSALSNNFLLGQYYLLILFLLACAVWCLLRGREAAGGALIGMIFALKLYTAPFLLFFAARKQWRALAGFVGAVAALGAAAVAIFGRDAVWYFLTTVMARGMDGTVNDPYNPGWASMSAFLRRTFVFEGEWNPRPLVQAPALFFFLRTAYVLGVLAIALVAVRRRPHEPARALPWFVIVLFALSPNTASYHYILLLVPLVLLLADTEAGWRWKAGLILLYIAVELPLYSWDARFFPKAWLLLALFLYVGRRFLPKLPWVAVGLFVVCAAGAETVYRMHIYRTEPLQVNQVAAPLPGQYLASAPVLSGDGLIYQAMGNDRFVLRRPGREFSFEGEAVHPSQARAGGAIWFELVSGGHSRICRFEPRDGSLSVVVGPELDPTEPAVSPDGKRLAFISRGSLFVTEDGRNRRIEDRPVTNPTFFPDGTRLAFAKGLPGERRIIATSLSGGGVEVLVERGDCFQPAVSPDGKRLAFACSETGSRQIWIQDLASSHAQRVTDGPCQNDSPAWDLDSRSVVFASDCNRGLGLTALYRAALGNTVY